MPSGWGTRKRTGQRCRPRRAGGLALACGLAGATLLAGAALLAQEPLRVTLEFAGAASADPTSAEPVRLELGRGVPTESVPSSGSLRVLVEGLNGALPTSVGLWSWDAWGEPLGELGPVPLDHVPCPPGTRSSSACGRTRWLRLVSGEVDREHPAQSSTSLRARAGGRVLVEAGGEPLSALVGGPRELEGGLSRAPTRVQVLRAGPGGAPALAPDLAQTRELAARALDEASALWEQCGMLLGPVAPSEVGVVDVGPNVLLEVGCHGGVPASGGQIRLSTSAGPIQLPTRPGESPASVAVRLQSELRRRGLVVTLSENPRSEARAGASYDLLVQASRGLRPLEPFPGDSLSTDDTLEVCWAEVDLGDGLSHFEDETAKAGTIEERALLRGVADADAGTIDVVVVPYFAGRGRLGESFIGGGGASLVNLVILDRAGVRATVRSSTLAHEIGHILLEQPGHPDDFGRDEPTRLMDADASDPTAFGPRRLELDECRRAWGAHGPSSQLPLLQSLTGQTLQGAVPARPAPR